MNRRTFLVAVLAPCAGVEIGGDAASPFRQPRPPSPLPPVSWSCPMHAEVVDDKAGKCPLCGMPLEPLRLALVWSCPIHTDVSEPRQGRCARCGRDLVRLTKALSFTCRAHPKIDVLDPGTCPICTRALVARYASRPHGDHNPKHGGYFFMASNNWHVEVTHPAVSVFRLYVYDDYSKPFSPSGLAARVIEAPDSAGKPSTVSVPFIRAPRGGFFEARMPGLGVPGTIAIKVRFEAGDAEYRFDFMFMEHSKEPAARVTR